MFGSKNVPLAAMSASSASVTWLPWVTAKQPAIAASRTAVAACACTHERSPSRRASPQAAAICDAESVCPPPSLMLLDAKILITSAPLAAVRRTHSRISSGVREVSENDPSDVSSRGPLASPRASTSRSAPSAGDPMLCTVVYPAISVTYALCAAACERWAGVSP